MESRESIQDQALFRQQQPRFRLRSRISLKRHAGQIFARIAGLPISLRSHHDRLYLPAAVVRLAYRRRFWAFKSASELVELMAGLILAPLILFVLSAWFLAKNGTLVAAHFHRPLHSQFADHLRLYFKAGVLPPWYYIYELYKQSPQTARTQLHLSLGKQARSHGFAEGAAAAVFNRQ